MKKILKLCVNAVLANIGALMHSSVFIKRAACLMGAFVVAGCASAPAPRMIETDRFEVVLDRHAEDVSKSWKDLVSLERGIQHATIASAEQSINERVQDFVFHGPIDQFVDFIGGVAKWRVEPAEGRRVGGSDAPVVNVKATGSTLKEVLSDAAAQTVGMADIVVKVPTRSIQIRYKD